MLKKLILITILFHLHNFASAANVEEKKGLKVKERFSSNLFIIKEDKIFTPPLSEGPLLGCMRSLVLGHFAVEEAALNLKDIQTADEIFFTNCNGIRYVKKFGKFDSYTNKISKKVVKKLNSLI